MIRKLIVTGLGTGYLPLAPGSWGSAVVAGLFLLAGRLVGRAGIVGFAMLALAAAASAGCAVLGQFAEKAFARKDPPQCNLDEWAGQALTFVLLPLGGGWRQTLTVAAAGFVAFRALDVIKPPPARRLQRLAAGWGIVADDLVAGLYANVACQLVLRLGFGL